MADDDPGRRYAESLRRDLPADHIDDRITELRKRINRESSVRDLLTLSVSVILLATLSVATAIARMFTESNESNSSKETRKK